mgnify:FL=1
MQVLLSTHSINATSAQGGNMSKATANSTDALFAPNRIFAFILLKYGISPKAMWKRNGIYGCGNSGFRFYPNDFTVSIDKWESEYIGGRYERNFVTTFYKVSINKERKTISWEEVSLNKMIA